MTCQRGVTVAAPRSERGVRKDVWVRLPPLTLSNRILVTGG